MSGERIRRLRELEARVGHSFTDPGLLDRALTHASFANESLDPDIADNEALEFLGDAVLGLVIADLLYRRDPAGPEGDKSRRRAQLVAATSLSRRAAELGLPELLRLGRGEEKTGGREKVALWANAYEALAAALYLDGGFAEVVRFVRAEFSRDLAERPEPFGDPKTELQERLQGAGRPIPEYVVVAEEGPGHRRRFRVECRLDDGTVTAGEEFSKKAAQQTAARLALVRLATPALEAVDLSPRSSRRPGTRRRRRKPRPAPG